MNAPDANLLLYAYNLSDPLHPPARAYLEDSLSGEEEFGLPILSVHAFVRISTSHAWAENRLAMQDALDIVDSWISRPTVRILYPGPRHWYFLRKLAGGIQLSSKQFSDAAIAAIALEHDAVIHTHDRDFSRFPGIRWSDPLAP